MNYNDHSNLEGCHAILAPSSPSWLNYSEEAMPEKLYSRYRSLYAKDLGTALHEYAAKRIKYRLKILKNRSEENAILFYLLEYGIPENLIDMELIFTNLAAYVNDAIGYKMDSEVLLYFSEYCFGTADSISFRNNLLRIHDLKTGFMPVKIEQLEIYAALFFLEYGLDPRTTDIELRIYQSDDIALLNPSADDILLIMDKIKESSKCMEEIKEE